MDEDLSELSTDELIERFDRGESLIEEGDELERLNWEEVELSPRDFASVTVELIEEDLEYLHDLSEEWGLDLSKLVRIAVRDFIVKTRDERDSGSG